MKHKFTRQLLAAALFVFISTTTAFGQCVIDTNNFALIGPASEELPCVERGMAYNVTLQLFCPPDIGGITIDSIKVTTFPGMPVGLTKESTPSSEVMYPLGRMCISISGTTNDSTGEYEILYNGTAYTSAGNAPFTYLRANLPGSLPDYILTVIDSGAFCVNTDTVATGISSVKNTAVFSVYPNPTTGVFTFALATGQSKEGEINVTDVTGRTVFMQKTTAVAFYQTTIDISGFAKGIYFVQYRTAGGVVSKKIISE